MRRLLSILIVATVVLVIAACARVLVQRVLDYDEIAHAHAVWLTSLGDVPYRDFFENHPPLPWLALSPIARGGTDGEVLALRLRISSAIGQLLTILLIVAHMRIGRRDIDPLWTAVAMLTMLASEGNVDYLIECRPDVWAAAMLLGGMLIARTERFAPFARYAAFGFLAAASLLWSPKLVALAGAFALIELVKTRQLLAMLTGALAAIAIAYIAMRAFGIDVIPAYRMMLDYNTLLGTRAGYRYGLAKALAAQWVLTLPAAGGFVCWLVAAARRELRPNAFDIAMAVFLATQIALVPFPYKQYFAPWFFFAAVFIPFWSLYVDRVRPLRMVVLPAALLILFVKAALVFQIAGTTHSFARNDAYWRFVKQHTDANRRIVAPMAMHPITARDGLYAAVGTTGVDEHYGPEAILRELRDPRFSPRFTYASYLRELEANSPAVIVIGQGPDSLFPEQKRAVAAYLRKHAYEPRMAGRQLLYVRD